MASQRKHLPADERRAVTVEAVVKLAAAQNPGEITTAAIATAMQLTQGALFRHFPNKEAIWQAVMTWVADHLLARLDRAARDASGPLAALEAMYMAHIAFVVGHPGVPRMLFSELQRAEDTAAKRMVQTMLREYGKRLQALIKTGQACGEVDPDLDPAAAASLYIGSIQGLVMQALLAGNTRRMRQEAVRTFAIYRRGIAHAA
jgi:AcrR family transcriptional regulator